MGFEKTAIRPNRCGQVTSRVIPSSAKSSVFTLDCFLAFLIGALIPLISLRTTLGTAAASFQERIAIVDILTLFLIIIFILRGIRFHLSIVLYGLSLLVSLFIANILAVTYEEWQSGIVNGIALLVALCYWVVGYNISRHKLLMHYLILGLMFGLFYEFLIVVHDYFATTQFFPDVMRGRVRGTFRANGQLGIYGYVMAGIIFTISYSWFNKTKVKFVILSLGLAAVFIVVAASRRSAMISLAIWLVAFLLLAIPSFKIHHLVAIIVCLAIGIMIFNATSDEFTVGFTWQRLVNAFETLETPNAFTFRQLQRATDNISAWFPFGMGLGRWSGNYDIHELHNAHLALLVESGLISFVVFCHLMLLPILRNRHTPSLTKYAIIGFIIASFFMMFHNTLHRDRTFMLTLGLFANYMNLLEADE
jgi:hypothetical protein